MSRQFSANQYEDGFCRSNRWEIPNKLSQYPKQQDGFTVVIANNDGHLLEGVKRSKNSPWGNFVDTWDFPLKIPGSSGLNTTARRQASAKGLSNLKENFDRQMQDFNIETSSLRNVMKKTKKNDVPKPKPAVAKDCSPRSETPQANQPEQIKEEKGENVTDEKPTDTESRCSSRKSAADVQATEAKSATPKPSERPESKSSSVH
ncbi:protein Flattop homolog [Octopus bimaculoides]|uniref:Cilia- and flagella-associated protein 126 n=1 Tax=Octopus bimaculoides TaxID=37653 RepID=A0A0L8HY73_OCTBM|nr:protein Flattop homolog [Octopus bimaculoides]|eukprot:XP_014768445.1 PREDICTED: protein Flattop homolog [Octopus bimaculoides]